MQDTLVYKSIRIFGLWIVLLLASANLLSAREIHVRNAGVKEANGIYVQKGMSKDHPVYVKDNCEIRYKGCRSKWVLFIDGKMMYKNRIDIEDCPFIGWETTCTTKKNNSKIPVFSLVIQEKDQKR